MEKIYNCDNLKYFKNKQSGGKVLKKVEMNKNYFRAGECCSLSPGKMKSRSKEKGFCMWDNQGYKSVGYNFKEDFGRNEAELPKIYKSSAKKTKCAPFYGNKKQYDTISRVYSPISVKSSNFTKKKNISETRRNQELNELQQFLFQFQTKSKLLLSQLEAKILGPKHCLVINPE